MFSLNVLITAFVVAIKPGTGLNLSVDPGF